MKLRFNKILIIIIFIFISNNANSLNLNDHRIVVLVNDNMITSYDIVQRMKINAILAGKNITPENSEQLANAVIEELIEGILKKEKIIEYEITVSNKDFLIYEENFYKKGDFNKDSLLKVFKTNNIDYEIFKNFLINEISWQKLIAGMYYRLTSVSDIEIEELLSKKPDILKDQAKNIIIQKQLDLKSTKLLRDIFNESTIEYK